MTMTEITRPLFQRVYIKDEDITMSLLGLFAVMDGGGEVFYIDLIFSLN
jgi:hypothetical protein